MTQEDKDILLRLLQQHKQLGVSDQIDYEKFYLYSIITHSAFVEMVDKWSIKPSLAEKMVDIMAFVVDKDEITTESIVSHFGYPPPYRQAPPASTHRVWLPASTRWKQEPNVSRERSLT